MTKDTYIKTVREALKVEPMIKLYDSHLSKLAALGRKVERGECAPKETVPDIAATFTPFIEQHSQLWKDLERALR